MVEQTCEKIEGLVIECKEGDFELCVLCNGEPVQSLEDRGGVVSEGVWSSRWGTEFWILKCIEEFR